MGCSPISTLPVISAEIGGRTRPVDRARRR
jgi:hypothetical protein